MRLLPGWASKCRSKCSVLWIELLNSRRWSRGTFDYSYLLTILLLSHRRERSPLEVLAHQPVAAWRLPAIEDMHSEKICRLTEVHRAHAPTHPAGMARSLQGKNLLPYTVGYNGCRVMELWVKSPLGAAYRPCRYRQLKPAFSWRRDERVLPVPGWS